MSGKSTGGLTGGVRGGLTGGHEKVKMLILNVLTKNTGGLGKIYKFHGFNKQSLYPISIICQLDIVNKWDFMNTNRKGAQKKVTPKSFDGSWGLYLKYLLS